MQPFILWDFYWIKMLWVWLCRSVNKQQLLCSTILYWRNAWFQLSLWYFMDSQMQEDLIPHLSGGSFVEQGLHRGWFASVSSSSAAEVLLTWLWIPNIPKRRDLPLCLLLLWIQEWKLSQDQRVPGQNLPHISRGKKKKARVTQGWDQRRAGVLGRRGSELHRWGSPTNWAWLL